MDVNVLKLENIFSKIGYFLRENYVGSKLVFVKQIEQQFTVEESEISIIYGAGAPVLGTVHKVHFILTNPDRKFIDYLSDDFSMSEISALADITNELNIQIGGSNYRSTSSDNTFYSQSGRQCLKYG